MKAAIITESSGKSVEVKGINGLFTCLLEHEVKATKAKFDFTGPKISPEMWAEVMAFFEWTQEIEKSESQVRLFLHPTHGWKAWAFPQKGGTGMTISEIEDHPDRATQRARFADHDGWTYFGTVHHHCTAGAFQSGTDTADEKNQDGLHITVGHMDKEVRDLHCRLYIKGHKFEPVMNGFWSIGEETERKAADYLDTFGIIPDLDKVARKQMSFSSAKLRANAGLPPVSADIAPFPAEWRANYIIPVRFTHQYELGNHVSTNSRCTKEWCDNCKDWSWTHGTKTCPFNKGVVSYLNQGNGTVVGSQALTKRQRKELKKAEREYNKKLITDIGGAAGKALEAIRLQANSAGMTDTQLFELIENTATGSDSFVLMAMAEECAAAGVSIEDLYDTAQEIVVNNLKKEIEKDNESAKMIAEGGGQAEINGQVGYEHGGYGYY
jgi:hypothetical protein